MSNEIIYHASTIKLVINKEIFQIPCNLAITEDNQMLLIVLKQDKIGTVQEILKILLEEGERQWK